MIWPFGTRARLLRELDRLAFYNDKNIAYLKHDDAQVQIERVASTTRIEKLVSEIGRNHLPQPFLTALGSGYVATDVTGHYFRLVKSHFRNASAP